MTPQPANNRTADETGWIASAQKGNVGAFNDLVLSYQELAYNVALRLLGHPEGAADATQDAFVAAFRHLDQFKGGSFRAWLLRIVTNCCHDQGRMIARHPTQSLELLTDDPDSSYDPPDRGESPERAVLRQEVAAELQRCLLSLPTEQRVVVILYDVHGLSYDEISQVTQANAGTVKSRLSRGRARLREFVRQSSELLQS